MRGTGGIERGAGDLVGVGEKIEEDEDIVLEGGDGGSAGKVNAAEELAEGGEDVTSHGERGEGREVGIDIAEGVGVGEVV